MMKHSITEFFCLIQGITNRGINVSISLWAIIKGGHRIRLGNNVLIDKDVMLIADERNSFIDIALIFSGMKGLLLILVCSGLILSIGYFDNYDRAVFRERIPGLKHILRY